MNDPALSAAIRAGSIPDDADLLRVFSERRFLGYNPWEDIFRRTGVDLRWHSGKLSAWDRPLGVTFFDELAVSLLVGLPEHQMRCTLTHELLHLDRGPVAGVKSPDDPRQKREENAIDLRVAKRMVDPVLHRLLLERWPDPKGSIRTILGVDRSTFRRYSKWRARVTDKTAERVWNQGRELSEWPAHWVVSHPWAARFAAKAD